jgi:hypothetical protein
MAGGGAGYTLSGVGSTVELKFPQPHEIQHRLQRQAPSTIWGVVNSGTLTYQVEASPDGIAWVPITGFTGLTASKVGNLNGYMHGLRLTVTSYSSGSVTLFVDWSL